MKSFEPVVYPRFRYKPIVVTATIYRALEREIGIWREYLFLARRGKLTPARFDDDRSPLCMAVEMCQKCPVFESSGVTCGESHWRNVNYMIQGPPDPRLTELVRQTYRFFGKIRDNCTVRTRTKVITLTGAWHEEKDAR